MLLGPPINIRLGWNCLIANTLAYYPNVLNKRNEFSKWKSINSNDVLLGLLDLVYNKHSSLLPEFVKPNEHIKL
jgi:glutathionylspermidine synthase